MISVSQILTSSTFQLVDNDQFEGIFIKEPKMEKYISKIPGDIQKIINSYLLEYVKEQVQHSVNSIDNNCIWSSHSKLIRCKGGCNI